MQSFPKEQAARILKRLTPKKKTTFPPESWNIDETTGMERSSTVSASSTQNAKIELPDTKANRPLDAGPSNGVVKAMVIFNFAGQESGDLTLEQGEVITILKKSERVDDWWTGSNSKGEEGIFPANYVQVI